MEGIIAWHRCRCLKHKRVICAKRKQYSTYLNAPLVWCPNLVAATAHVKRNELVRMPPSILLCKTCRSHTIPVMQTPYEGTSDSSRWLYPYWNKFWMKIIWKQGTHQRNENSRLGFIKSVHMQLYNGATLPSPPSTGFSGTLFPKGLRMSQMIPNDQKIYNLHYADAPLFWKTISNSRSFS